MMAIEIPRKLLLVLTGLTSLISVSACIPIRETTVPLQTEYFAKNDESEVLVILLPGIGESPTAFEENGVVSAIRRCRPNADILGVDAHYGYYKERSVDQRLFEDVVATPQAKGKRIWLLGSSLGGLGSLIYSVKYPDSIEWVALMAPYLGEKDELRAFVEDDEKLLDGLDPAFIQLWTALSQEEWRLPRTSLAFGESDRFSYQHQWLSTFLPDDQVFPVEGKHRWSVWKDLWPEVIKTSGYCVADN